MKKLLIVTLFILTNIALNAEQYELLRSTGPTPLAASISRDKNNNKVILQSIDSEGSVTFCSTSPYNSGGTANTVGKIKTGGVLTYRFDNEHPAVRIKVIEVNLENGYAVLEISTFWPQPNK